MFSSKNSHTFKVMITSRDLRLLTTDAALSMLIKIEKGEELTRRKAYKFHIDPTKEQLLFMPIVVEVSSDIALVKRNVTGLDGNIKTPTVESMLFHRRSSHQKAERNFIDVKKKNVIGACNDWKMEFTKPYCHGTYDTRFCL